MPSISQHISPNLISLGRTSIIYAVTDIVFSLKQNIPPSGELFFRSIIITPPESWPIEICCLSSRLGAGFIARLLLAESWRSCPTAFLLRSGECLPRHPVSILFSRCMRGFFAPHPLFVTFSKFHNQKSQKNFLSLPRTAFFLLLTAC